MDWHTSERRTIGSIFSQLEVLDRVGKPADRGDDTPYRDTGVSRWLSKAVSEVDDGLTKSQSQT